MPTEEEEIINLIAQELMAGKSVDAVAAELVQAGLPRNEAYTVVGAVAKQIGAKKGGPGGRPVGPPPRRRSSMMPYYIMIVAIGILAYLILAT